MRRREFVGLLVGAAATTIAVPLAARGRQANKVYRIGYLSLGSPAAEATRFNAFRAGLAALGYVEGKNLVIETRWLNGGKYDQLAGLAAQLVDLMVDVIVTYSTSGVRPPRARRRQSHRLRIGRRCRGYGPRIRPRPAGRQCYGNVVLPSRTCRERVELLKEALPGLVRAGVLFNPANPAALPDLAAMRLTAASLKLELSEFAAREASDLEDAFAAMATKSVSAFMITEDPMLIYNSGASAKLALKYRLASCGFPEFAQAGGLAAYGIDFVDLWRHAATFVDKILKGANPADLPVEQATKFVTMVNLKTAKAIGVEVPSSLLARADEVIE